MSTRGKKVVAPTVVTQSSVDSLLSGAADAVKIQRISLVSKDIAKGLRDQVKDARGKCPGGGFMYQDKCVRLEEALLQCGSSGVSVANNQLSCGGGGINLPAGALDQTAKMLSESSIFTQEHNLKVEFLVNSFKKKHNDLKLSLENATNTMNAKFNIMSDKVVLHAKSSAERDTALKNIESEKAIASKVLEAKASEAELKFQKAISEAFPRLLESTLKRLDQLAKSRKLLLVVNLSSGAKRVAGLARAAQPKPAAEQGLSLLSAPAKKRRRCKKYTRRA